MTLTIGVDVGGTKISAGVVDEDGRIVAGWKGPTPGRAEHVVGAVCGVIERLRRDHEVMAVGLGVGGFVDVRRTTVLFAKNIGWVGEPLKAKNEESVGLPVVVENDANAAAWGEARFGAGRGEACLVCLTVGTGIGGGLVIDGRLHRGRFDLAAECGHLLVVPGGLPCGCGGDGCWEMYCSGTALVREAQRLAVEASAHVDGLLMRVGGRPEEITGGTITSAAQDGVPGAVDLLRRMGWWLGRGIASLAAILDPGCFVVGGGVSEAGDLILEPARESFRNHLPGRGHRGEARIVLAELGGEAGLIGAADLARQGG